MKKYNNRNSRNPGFAHGVAVHEPTYHGSWGLGRGEWLRAGGAAVREEAVQRSLRPACAAQGPRFVARVWRLRARLHAGGRRDANLKLTSGAWQV
jgi:hypothetical protein